MPPAAAVKLQKCKKASSVRTNLANLRSGRTTTGGQRSANNPPRAIVAALLKDGRAHVTGLYSEKSGKTYDATVVLEDTGQYVNFKLEFDRQKGGGK